ncbi:unnamed protein product [Owenia fusiformis]|uniref:Uncharacterized protein n=1 Tax=Owenia fusiformis TaxID=6347 RepID=A0A8S4NJD9_OWEFU|nr:unnamed protein product [Owenia fusiformis]
MRRNNKGAIICEEKFSSWKLLKAHVKVCRARVKLMKKSPQLQQSPVVRVARLAEPPAPTTEAASPAPSTEVEPPAVVRVAHIAEPPAPTTQTSVPESLPVKLAYFEEQSVPATVVSPHVDVTVTLPKRKVVFQERGVVTGELLHQFEGTLAQTPEKPPTSAASDSPNRVVGMTHLVVCGPSKKRRRRKRRRATMKEGPSEIVPLMSLEVVLSEKVVGALSPDELDRYKLSQGERVSKVDSVDHFIFSPPDSMDEL